MHTGRRLKGQISGKLKDKPYDEVAGKLHHFVPGLHAAPLVTTRKQEQHQKKNGHPLSTGDRRGKIFREQTNFL